MQSRLVTLDPNASPASATLAAAVPSETTAIITSNPLSTSSTYITTDSLQPTYSIQTSINITQTVRLGGGSSPTTSLMGSPLRPNAIILPSHPTIHTDMYGNTQITLSSTNVTISSFSTSSSPVPQVLSGTGSSSSTIQSTAGPTSGHKRSREAAPERGHSTNNPLLHSDEERQSKFSRTLGSVAVSGLAASYVLPTAAISTSSVSGKGRGKNRSGGKGKNAHKPLTIDELKGIVNNNQNKSFQERIAAVFQHATTTKVVNVVTSRLAQRAVWRNSETQEIVKRRSIRVKQEEHIPAKTLHLSQTVKSRNKSTKDIGLRMRITASSLFNQQGKAGDSTCDSWVDAVSDDKLILNTNLFWGNDSGNPILRHVCRIKNPDAAARLDRELGLGAGVLINADEMKEKKDIPIEPDDKNELHTIHARNELSGTFLYSFFKDGLRPLYQGATQFVDDSKFTNEQDAYRIPLRILFPILCSKTYYEKLNPGEVNLIEGQISTAFNGVLDQNKTRRDARLEKLQNYRVSTWLDALQQQADAKLEGTVHANNAELPEQLLNLATKYISAVKNIEGLRKSALTVKQLVEAVYDVSKKAGGAPTPDLICLSHLLCDGIFISDDTGYSKQPVPGKKINELREYVHELMWGSYIWSVQPLKTSAATPGISFSS